MVEQVERRMVVFGASGGVGSECVKQALAQGIPVTAFVRSPEKLGDLQGRQGLKVFRGDIRDAAKIRQCLVEGQFDNILTCLGGASIWSEDDLITAGTRNITAALRDV